MLEVQKLYNGPVNSYTDTLFVYKILKLLNF